MIPFLMARTIPLVTLIGLSLGGAPSWADESVWAQLAQGGKVVLMRHAQTGTGSDAGNPRLRDPSCKLEANLSELGRSLSRAVGERLRARGVSVAEVRYSPYCRTADTAREAFGQGVPAEYLSLYEVLGAEAAQAQLREVREIIGSHSGTGNLLLVSHSPNINAIASVVLEHLDMLVLMPRGGSEFDVVGVIRRGQ